MPVTLEDLGNEAALHTQELLDAVLPGERSVRPLVDAPAGAVLVLCDSDLGQDRPVPLFVDGRRRASLGARSRHTLDYRTGRLVTDWSRWALYARDDREPLVRLEYEQKMTSAPRSHWHFHGERGSFTELLVPEPGRRATRSPSRLSSLHLPTGDDVFRPSLADFLEFLIVECGVDAHPGWEAAVASERVRCRRAQVAEKLRHAIDDGDGRPSRPGLDVADVRWVDGRDFAMTRR